jgi:DNA repair protein RecO (recombination protein O)
MSSERASGLVLRTRTFTETSLIVHWLTDHAGRISTLAKGALRAKSPFRGKLDLFYQADLSFSRSRRSDLHTLREVVVRETHPALRHDWGSLRRAAYGALLIEQVTESETPVEGLYRLLLQFLVGLAAPSPGPALVLAFEFAVLEELGLGPDPARAGLSEGGAATLRSLANGGLISANVLPFTPKRSAELERLLGRVLRSHLGREPRGRAAALAPPL